MDINIGDIVKLNRGKDYLFIVVEIDDYSDDEENDIDYELAQIYPQRQTAKIITEGIGDISLFAKRGSSNYNLKMRILNEERLIKDWGKADYIEMIEEALEESLTPIKQGEQVSSDGISYLPTETIDECLDAINGLESLYGLLKDEKYLEKKKLVIERLTILSQ